jgi:hypothetical protein
MAHVQKDKFTQVVDSRFASPSHIAAIGHLAILRGFKTQELLKVQPYGIEI